MYLPRLADFSVVTGLCPGGLLRRALCWSRLLSSHSEGQLILTVHQISWMLVECEGNLLVVSCALNHSVPCKPILARVVRLRAEIQNCAQEGINRNDRCADSVGVWQMQRPRQGNIARSSRWQHHQCYPLEKVVDLGRQDRYGVVH